MIGTGAVDHGTTVLLVDDDHLSLEVAAALLESAGHRVRRARSGSEAIALLNAALSSQSERISRRSAANWTAGAPADSAKAVPQRGLAQPPSAWKPTEPDAVADVFWPEIGMPALVLVDMQMPGVSGEQVGSFVKELPAPRPRVIGMSATPPRGNLSSAFDGFLLKPLALEELIAAVPPLQSATRAARLTASSPSRKNAAEGNPHEKDPADSRKLGALDPAVIEKLRALMPPEAIREIYVTYIQDTRGRIDELERYVSSGDADGIRRCAHMMKGSALMAGVRNIAVLASALEAGIVLEKNHRNIFHNLRLACDDVERSIAPIAPESPV